MTRPASCRALPRDRFVRVEAVSVDRIRFDAPHAPDPSYPWDALEASIASGWNPAHRGPPLRVDGNSAADGYDPFVVFPRDDGTFAPLQGWHRVEVLRRLGAPTVRAFVVRPWEVDDESAVASAVAQYARLESQPQALDLPWPGCQCAGRGDPTQAIWQDTGWNWWHWCGRTVLDLGCSAGASGIEALRHGATIVDGIDTDGAVINVASVLMKALDRSIVAVWMRRESWSDFVVFSRVQRDIVLANQCLYWFGEPESMLDHLCRYSREWIAAYTHVMPEHYTGTEPGWRPTEEEAIEAFRARGFAATVRPHDPALGWATKRTIVARRMR